MEIRDERFFIDTTLERAQHLIRQGVWEGLDLARSRSWYHQFEQRQCGLLGACLLDNLVYRSKAQLIALLTSVITSPELLEAKDDDDHCLVSLLRSRRDAGIRLVPVIRLDQPPTKSGMYILRLLSREFGVRDQWMVWPQALGEQPEIHTLLLIDDFCGSGDQFIDFLETPSLKQFLTERPRCRIVYVSAAAHEKGLSNINSASPRVEVLAAEVLGGNHHFFSGTVLDQYRIDGLKNQLLAQYIAICEEFGLGSGKIGHFGYDDQALAYGFTHGTPNNSLPILWQDARGWTPLLHR